VTKERNCPKSHKCKKKGEEKKESFNHFIFIGGKICKKHLIVESCFYRVFLKIKQETMLFKSKTGPLEIVGEGMELSEVGLTPLDKWGYGHKVPPLSQAQSEIGFQPHFTDRPPVL
jgi:hypothetical protein